jgi:mono/diheme cytochrome c family protein
MNRIVRQMSVVALPACAFAAFLFAAVTLSIRLSASALPGPDAQQIYLDKCAVCHAKDGSGSTAKGKKVKAKDLRSAEVKKMTDAELLDAVAKGKGKDMDGFQKELGADAVKELVVYCRSLASQ